MYENIEMIAMSQPCAFCGMHHLARVTDDIIQTTRLFLELPYYEQIDRVQICPKCLDKEVNHFSQTGKTLLFGDKVDEEFTGTV